MDFLSVLKPPDPHVMDCKEFAAAWSRHVKNDVMGRLTAYSIFAVAAVFGLVFVHFFLSIYIVCGIGFLLMVEFFYSQVYAALRARWRLEARGYYEFDFFDAFIISEMIGKKTEYIPVREDAEGGHVWAGDPYEFVWYLEREDAYLELAVRGAAYQNWDSVIAIFVCIVLPVVFCMPTFLITGINPYRGLIYVACFVALIVSVLMYLIGRSWRLHRMLLTRGWYWIEFIDSFALSLVLPRRKWHIPRRVDMKAVPGFRDGEVMVLVEVLKGMRRGDE